MGPLIDQELEQVDRKHAQLTQLSADLVEAVNLYYTLMREPHGQQPSIPYGYMPQPHQVPLPPHSHNTVSAFFFFNICNCNIQMFLDSAGDIFILLSSFFATNSLAQ